MESENAHETTGPATAAATLTPAGRMSFDDFLTLRLGVLLRFAAVVTCDPALAEDVVRDVLVRAHEGWPRISALPHPDTYLNGMVVAEYLSWRRRSSRMFARARRTPVDGARPRPGAPAEDAGRDALMRRIAALPARQRAVVVLRYLGGMTDAQIADALHCSETSVRTHAARAVTALHATPPGRTSDT